MKKGAQPLRFLTLFPSLVFPCHFPSPWPQNLTQEPPGEAGLALQCLEKFSAGERDFPRELPGISTGELSHWEQHQPSQDLPAQPGSSRCQGKQREEPSSAEGAARLLQSSRALAGAGSSAGAGAEHPGVLGESQALAGTQLGWSWARNAPREPELLWSLCSPSSSISIG